MEMKWGRAMGRAARLLALLLCPAASLLAQAPAAAPAANPAPNANAPAPANNPPANNPASSASNAATPPVPFVGPDDSSSVVMNYPPTTPGAGASGLHIQGLPGETVPWSIVILLTGLTLIPSMLLCITPFARLLIVFHFLRQALGLQTTPSNQTLIGLSLILTFFLMQPVGLQIYDASIVPMQAGQITAMEALTRGEIPMRKFMAHYVRDKDVALFVELAKEPRSALPERPVDARASARVHSVGTQGRISDRHSFVSAVPDCRYGRRFHHHLRRHAAVASGGDLHAFEVAALSDGRWLASVDRFSYEEL